MGRGTTVLQWLNSTSKLLVFVANRFSKLLGSTTIDERFHVSSGDNPADTGTRGITAEALKESGWLKGPYFSKTKERPIKPDPQVLTSVRLKDPSYNFYEGIKQAATFICISKTTDLAFARKD